MLAVLGAGDQGQPGVHGPALGDVIGDRVPQLAIVIVLVQENAVRQADLPSLRVGVQDLADQQPPAGDCLDPEQVPVCQSPAGLPRLHGVVVDGADDQVPGTGTASIGDRAADPAVTRPRWIRSSRIRRDSSRRLA